MLADEKNKVLPAFIRVDLGKYGLAQEAEGRERLALTIPEISGYNSLRLKIRIFVALIVENALASTVTIEEETG